MKGNSRIFEILGYQKNHYHNKVNAIITATQYERNTDFLMRYQFHICKLIFSVNFEGSIV